MKVSCIIVNYNLRYLPRLCIEALKRSKVNFKFEIIVVDNNSDDDSVDYLRQMQKSKEITLIESKTNLGYGKGNNLAATHAKGEYLLILNPDVSVEENTLQRMVDYLDEHKKVGVVGPQLYFFNGSIQDSCRRFMQPLDLIIKRTPLRRLSFFKKRLHHYVMADYDHTTPREVDIVTGACFMMPKDLFKEIDGFDPRYFLFMEDIDLCRKVWEKGRSVVYLPRARALHYHKRLSSGNIFRLMMRPVFWYHLASAGRYFWKWRGKKNPTRAFY